MTRVIMLSVAAVLLATSSAGAATSRGTVVIKLLSKERTAQFFDAAPKGWSNGDHIDATSSLRNAVPQLGKPEGALVGGDTARLLYMTSSFSANLVTASLPGGTIKYVGRYYHGADRQVMGVVKGSGRFADATGTVVITRAPRNRYGADSLNVFTLRLR